MGEGIRIAIRGLASYVTGGTPDALSIPDGVGDPEAIHAVQRHYAEAGFECDEDTAHAIVDGSR